MRKLNKYIATLFCLFFLSAEFLIVYQADARPGGGSSYRSRSSSSSSRSSSSSSGRSSSSYGGGIYVGSSSSGSQSSESSDAEDAITFIFFAIVTLVFLIKFIIDKIKQYKAGFVVSSDFEEKRLERNLLTSQKIEELKQRDSNFSKILFLDFVGSLYNKFYNYLNTNKLNNLKPFISEADINRIKQAHNGKINEIVIGSINIVSISEDEYNDYITAEIDANYTVVNGKKGIRYLTLERWKFFRKKGVLSKEPDVMKNVSCPNCSAPTDFNDSGECNYCKTFINKGDMQWAVESIYEVEKEQFVTNTQNVDVEEEGTNYPTIINPDIASYKSIYLQRNNIADWQTFWETFKDKVVKDYFNNIYKSWSENRLIESRVMLSDRLYESFDFWVNSYKRDGLINKLENINISNIQLSNVDIDKFYDSITVRIYASSNDYIQDSNGKVVSGSKTKKRNFSEYWTFIKRSGLRLNEKNIDLKKCPSCSATVENIGQGGKCNYCGSKISDGDFSWILAIITQDDVYEG